jgi:hypothetical protein
MFLRAVIRRQPVCIDIPDRTHLGHAVAAAAVDACQRADAARVVDVPDPESRLGEKPVVVAWPAPGGSHLHTPTAHFNTETHRGLSAVYSNGSASSPCVGTGQQPEGVGDHRPAPSPGMQLDDLDRQRVARLCALDVDWVAHRVAPPRRGGTVSFCCISIYVNADMSYICQKKKGRYNRNAE